MWKKENKNVGILSIILLYLPQFDTSCHSIGYSYLLNWNFTFSLGWGVGSHWLILLSALTLLEMETATRDVWTGWRGASIWMMAGSMGWNETFGLG